MQARHAGNRYRRADDNNQAEHNRNGADSENGPNNAEFWLRNWVVGPPIGAPHISLNVKTEIDDDFTDLLDSLNGNNNEGKENNNNLKLYDQNKADNNEAADRKGSSPPAKKDNTATGNNQENNRNDSNDKKRKGNENNKGDGGKRNQQDSKKPASDDIKLEPAAEDPVLDIQKIKKPNNDKNDSSKESKSSDDNPQKIKDGADIGRNEYRYSFR